MRTVMVTSVSRKMSNVCFKAHTRFLFQGEISKQHLQKKMNLDLLVSKDMIWIYIYIHMNYMTPTQKTYTIFLQNDHTFAAGWCSTPLSNARILNFMVPGCCFSRRFTLIFPRHILGVESKSLNVVTGKHVGSTTWGCFKELPTLKKSTKYLKTTKYLD